MMIYTGRRSVQPWLWSHWRVLGERCLQHPHNPHIASLTGTALVTSLTSLVPPWSYLWPHWYRPGHNSDLTGTALVRSPTSLVPPWSHLWPHWYRPDHSADLSGTTLVTSLTSLVPPWSHWWPHWYLPGHFDECHHGVTWNYPDFKVIPRPLW